MRILLFILFLLLPGLAVGEEESRLVTHGSRRLPRIALTFDLCQGPTKPAGYDEKLVRILLTEKIPATFFAGGLWLRDHPEAARELAAVPFFEIASHSWDHPDFRRLGKAEIRQQIDKTAASIRTLTNREAAPLFRLPYGYYDDNVLAELEKLQIRPIQWDVVTGDPDPQVTAAAIIQEVERSAKNGSIIIMHANGRGVHSAEALPELIRILRRRGLTPVMVTDLLAAKSQ